MNMMEHETRCSITKFLPRSIASSSWKIFCEIESHLLIGDDSGSCPFLSPHLGYDSLVGDDSEMIMAVMDSNMVKILIKISININ